MNNPQVIAFLNLALVVLLPMVPAYVLFRALPCTAVVKGPLKGLDLNLGGAFAGYFALLLLVLSTHSFWNPPLKQQIWEVSGSVTDEDGNALAPPFDIKDIELAPASFRGSTNGMFSLVISTVPTPGGGREFPTLIINYPGYQQKSVPLDPYAPFPDGLRFLANEGMGTIKIGTISLKKMPSTEYGDTRAQNALPR